MKRVEELIERSKRQTENDNVCSSSPITDQEYIDYLNDAQAQLQSAIARQHKNVFIAETLIDVVYNQESYSMPEDTLLDNRITAMYYTDSGRDTEFRRLRSGTLIERVFTRSIDPLMYIRRTGGFILNPTPKRSVVNGVLLMYVKRLPTLDIRRAKIASVSTSGNTITSLVLDTSQLIDSEELTKESSFSIVSPDGNQVMRRVEYTNIDTGTGTVTLDPGFTFDDGETVSAGDYLVRGRDATNQSELADTCERYLSAYLDWKIFKRDSSSDSAEQTQELIQMTDEIVEIYKETDDDIKYPAIEDAQFIDDEDLWNYY